MRPVSLSQWRAGVSSSSVIPLVGPHRRYTGREPPCASPRPLRARAPAQPGMPAPPPVSDHTLEAVEVARDSRAPPLRPAKSFFPAIHPGAPSLWTALMVAALGRALVQLSRHSARRFLGPRDLSPPVEELQQRPEREMPLPLPPLPSSRVRPQETRSLGAQGLAGSDGTRRGHGGEPRSSDSGLRGGETRRD